MPTDIQKVQEILAKLTGFNTVSRYPNRALIDWVRAYLKSHGIDSEIFASDDGGKACLWATIGAPGKTGIAIAGHTDVVPVDGQKWHSDPFTLTERDGKLYGRGACDMKGFIACALAFVPEFLAAKTDGCFHLALTCDEETDMSGAMRLTDALAARKIVPEWIWIGEPTGLSIVDEHKGVAAYHTEITGIAAHSGQPARGVNAIGIANGFMNIIEETARRRAEKPYAPSRFDPPYTTLNLGVIKGGAAENIIAGDCALHWQIRAYPGEAAQDILAVLTAEADKIIEARAASFPGVSLKTCICCDIPAFRAMPDNVGAALLKKLLKCDETHAVPFATEAGIFQKLGAGAVVCGPGSIDQAHQPNEFVDKSQLTACVDLMRAVLLSSTALH